MVLRIAYVCGTVTADSLMECWVLAGGRLTDFGNSAGAIFRDARLEFTGQMVPCKRRSGHGRLIRVWRRKSDD
jgi:hypothetical protein